MSSTVEEIRKNINLFEYRNNPTQSDSPEDFDAKPNLTDGQRALVKSMYNTDAFSIESSLSDLKLMLNK